MSNPDSPLNRPAEAKARPQAPDPHVYVPQSAYQAGPEYRQCVEALLPKQWRLQLGSFWTQALSPIRPLTVQGWKIHISALPATALETLRIVAPVCMARGIEFKFASDSAILLNLLSKNCARQASGKFITIYAPTAEQCRLLLEELHPLLRDKTGPYILSDRRYKDSQVLHYRYGGFHTLVEESANGARKMCILGQEYAYTEDVRAPRFTLPDFVQDVITGTPAAATPSAAAEGSAATPAPAKDRVAQAVFGGKYKIESVIRFSNAGGVYLAKNIETEESLIIKEARPYIGMDSFGVDNTVRLRKEHRILAKIAHEGIAPVPEDIFQEWEHIFLPIEKIPGRTLREHVLSTLPLIHNDNSAEQVQTWMRDCVRLVVRLMECVAVLHRHGVVFGDLSLNNVMVDPDTLALRLIDFEGAFEPGVDAPCNMFTPGYGRPERTERHGIDFADDLYALGCVMLAMLAPNPTVNQLSAGYARDFATAVQAETGLPQAYIDCMLQLLEDPKVELSACIAALNAISWGEARARHLDTLPAEPDIDFCSQTVQGVFRYQDQVMDVRQPERVFPVASKLSDPMAVDRGMLGIAHARQQVQGRIPEALGDWIQRRFSTQAPRSGLMNGLSGTAWVLADLGFESQARAALKAAGMHTLLFQNMSLGYGVAGYGLSQLHFWTLNKEASHLREARKMADILCEAALVRPEGLAWEDPDSTQGAALGWMEGASGIALFLLYAFCVTGDVRYLKTGELGLQFDLAHGREAGQSYGFARRSLASDRILMPYLEHGAAGVGTVALRYLAVTGQPRYAEFAARIKSSVAHKFAVLPGLFTGLSGLGNYLLDAYQFLQDPSYLRLAHRAAQGVKLFHVPRGEGSAFPGFDQGKLTCDYADGSAGIALFLHRLLSGTGNFNFMLDGLLEQGRVLAHSGTAGVLAPSGLLTVAAEPVLQSA